MRRTSHAPNRHRVNDDLRGVWTPRAVLDALGPGPASSMLSQVAFLTDGGKRELIRSDGQWADAGLVEHRAYRARRKLVAEGWLKSEIERDGWRKTLRLSLTAKSRLSYRDRAVSSLLPTSATSRRRAKSGDPTLPLTEPSAVVTELHRTFLPGTGWVVEQ